MPHLLSALLAGSVALAQPRASSTPPMRFLTEQQLVDLVVGAAIYCTRGVNTENLVERARAAHRSGSVFRLVALEDIPDRWIGFTSFTVGGGGAWPHVVERLKKQGFTPQPDAPSAADVLADHLGVRFDAVFQAEAGGATVATLLNAARMGLPILDACPSSRCLPEVQMSPFFMSGITRAPLAATTYGDSIVVASALDDYRVEDITRA